MGSLKPPTLGFPPLRAPKGSPAELSQLVSTIEGEIVPRLMMVHRAGYPERERTETAAAHRLTPQDVSELARLVLAHDVSVAASFVELHRARGLPLESIYLDLLAPAARALGTAWEEDRVTFADVTIGLWRLQEVLYELTASLRAPAIDDDPAHRILLAANPGEQHTFGLIMVAEFFRRAGWQVTSRTFESRHELARAVRRDAFAVIGLSASCEDRLEALSTTIRVVRRSSRNRAIGVMVGGKPFVGHVERVSTVGADATAPDARQAPALARELAHQKNNRNGSRGRMRPDHGSG